MPAETKTKKNNPEAQAPVTSPKPDLAKLLTTADYVSTADMAEALDYVKKSGGDLQDYLLSSGLISNDLLGQALAEYYNVGYGDLNTYLPPREQILKIPEDVARKFNIVLFAEDKDTVTIATDQPSPALSAGLKQVFKNKKVKLVYSLTEDIKANFVHYRKPLETRFIKIIKKNSHIAPEIIDEIFADALTNHASDIHFEPQDKEVVIRFRVDGIMNEVGRIPRENYQNILNLIKVKSRLRMDEHQATQDGAIRYMAENRTIDMRVSITPVVDGEKAVIRVLSQYVKNYTLADIGLSLDNKARFIKAGKKPFGMIIVAGPTGSGKTTTLYTLLKVLNRPEVNITTIEDPVEFKLRGANQIQVNPQSNLTFASGLRSIVRQDPDIILVGEIRDEETAEIAVNAALTGHLLLSTFHANDAATVPPRLLDMGIEPFLLSSTLELVIAQRLVRKICEKCRTSFIEDRNETNKILENASTYLSPQPITLYKGKGCDNCNHTGYRGRTAIFEMIYFSKELKDLIIKNPSTQQIWQLAKSQGAISLFEDGLDKVKTGVTTLEELLRVAMPPLKAEAYAKQK